MGRGLRLTTRDSQVTTRRNTGSVLSSARSKTRPHGALQPLWHYQRIRHQLELLHGSSHGVRELHEVLRVVHAGFAPSRLRKLWQLETTFDYTVLCTNNSKVVRCGV